jgi:hypothetical protein
MLSVAPLRPGDCPSFYRPRRRQFTSVPHRFIYVWRHVLTPKFGKESDLWVQLGKESVSWKGRIFQMYSAKKSAVGYLLPFGKGTVELILRDWTMMWLKQGG